MPHYDRPGPQEYAPFYAGYIASVPEGDVLAILTQQTDDLRSLLAPLPLATWHHRYAPGKWSVAEVLGHLCDTERILACRALRFARGDVTPVPGFEENDYVPAAQSDARAFGGLLDEWATVRDATVSLVSGMPVAGWTRRGTVNDAAISARALVYIILGHVEHHRSVLDERYGVR